jgi:hypothetical protein
LKLFLATNTETKQTKNFLLIEKAIKSAIQNTDFEIFLIYDGDKTELDFSSRVNIIEHRHRLYPVFKNACKHLAYASSTFLRTEIPYICNNLGIKDKYVLYTDHDVIFNRADYSELDNIKPNFLAASTEIEKDNWYGFNAGVLLLNVDHFIEKDSFILDYITNNINTLYVWDQTMYNNLYRDKFTRLPTIYNWKVYWGIEPSAKIIHFHGPKPFSIQPKESYSDPLLNQLINKNIDSYNYYNKIFEEI